MVEDVANVTLVHLRRIDQTMARVLEVLERHETRLGRIERDIGELKRDIGEVKSDQSLFEDRLLQRFHEILTIVRRVDDHDIRLSRLEAAGLNG